MKVRRFLIGTILILLLGLILYVIWDNHRFVVRNQEIKIEGLPEEFDGFTILQISDLHEKTFGAHQERLIKAINDVEYDVIAFTGDMLQDSTSKNFSPFYELLEGIEKKDHAYFVPGNTDPESYQVNPLEKSDFVKGMERRGVHFLEGIETIRRNDSTLRFVYFENAIMGSSGRLDEGLPKLSYYRSSIFKEHQKKIVKQMDALDETNDPTIALNHFPVVDIRLDHIKKSPFLKMRDFDLILAGHYHGGQIRLPFIGAIFVPEAWYSSYFFPPQDRIKGLWEYNGVKQYVSAGLGNSEAIPLFGFRFMNPPELNVITLSSK